MPYYASRADLEARFGRAFLIAYADQDADNELDAAAADAALTDADAEIDARLAPRFAVPVDPVPDVLRAVAVVLAAERLVARRPDKPALPDRSAFDRARALLESIAVGQGTLVQETPSARAILSIGAADTADDQGGDSSAVGFTPADIDGF